MSNASSRRPEPAQPTPPPEEPEARFRVRYGAAEMVITGSRAVYVMALFASIYVGARAAGPALDAVRDATTALRDSATTLRLVADDAQAARAGVERLGRVTAGLDERLGRIETDVAALRVDVRACHAPQR